LIQLYLHRCHYGVLQLNDRSQQQRLDSHTRSQRGAVTFDEDRLKESIVYLCSIAAWRPFSGQQGRRWQQLTRMTRNVRLTARHWPESDRPTADR